MLEENVELQVLPVGHYDWDMCMVRKTLKGVLINHYGCVSQ